MTKEERAFLHNMYNGTSTDDGNGDIESYESWLERQLLFRIQELESKSISLLVHNNGGMVYGACYKNTDAEKLKSSFPNPKPIRIITVDISKNKKQYIY